MNLRLPAVAVFVLSLAAGVASAQAPAGAPAGSTGLCNDGTYWTGATKKGACRGHKGVKDWYGPTTPAGGAVSSTAGGNVATTPATTTPKAATSAPAKSETPSTPTAASAPAPGGGAGQVWVNNPSKVYHCPGTRWYGKTKDGEYMSEADAVAKGNRPDHGKACGK